MMIITIAVTTMMELECNTRALSFLPQAQWADSPQHVGFLLLSSLAQSKMKEKVQSTISHFGIHLMGQNSHSLLFEF